MQTTRSRPPRTALLLGIIAVLLIAVGVLAWLAFGRKAEKPAQQELSGPQPDGIVLRCGDYQMDNTFFGYYYWSEYFYVKGAMGSFLSDQVDFSKPLSEQPFSNTQSWEDYLIGNTLETIRQTLSMVFAAQEAGFTLPEESAASLESVMDSFLEYAVSMGFVQEDGSADLTAYLRDSYGPGAEIGSFRQYLTESYLASAYADSLYESRTFTDEEVAQYFDAHAADYPGLRRDDAPMVRAMVLEFADAATAATVCSGWEASGAEPSGLQALSEQYCAERAQELTVHQGQYPQAITDWLFAQRAVGDHACITDADVSCIVYYLGSTDRAYWQELALEDLRSEYYRNTLLSIESNYDFQIDRSQIVLTSPQGLLESQ